MPQAADDNAPHLAPEDASDSELNELVAQLGLSTHEAATAWNEVLAGLEQQETAGEAARADFTAGERFSLGELVDLFDGGEKPDLGELAKDELTKAVAKKLGIDPAQAGAVVDMILKALNKPGTKRRRKTATKPKPKPRKKPKTASSSTAAKPKPKPKPATSAAAKPKPKPKKTASSTSTTKPKPKPKKTTSSTASKPKPAVRPRKRTATRSGESVEA